MNKLILGTLGIFALATAACASATPKTSNVAAGSGCAQLGDTNVAVAPFYQQGNVYSAREVKERTFHARGLQPWESKGAELYMHAPADVTGEYMQRALSCHAARGVAAHPNDPLHPSQGEVTAVEVRSTGNGFAIKVLGDSRTTGKEIWQRAESFTAPRGSVTVDQVGLNDVTPTL